LASGSHAAVRLSTPSPWRHFVYVTTTLALTEFKLRYFGSVLGYLWTLLRPLMLFGVLYVVFTEVFRFGGDVPHYAVMLLAGLVVWSFFADATGAALPSLVQRESLLRKVSFPRAAIPIAVALTAAANLALGLLVVLVFAVVDGVKPSAGWLLLLPILLIVIALALAVAVALAVLFVRFRDVQPMWDVASQILFWGTPIIYMIEFVPARFRQAVMANPLAVAIQQLRHSVIDSNEPSAAAAIGGSARLLIPAAILLLVIAGSALLYKSASDRLAEDL
jgi:ABC-2 type transport system permease protein